MGTMKRFIFDRLVDRENICDLIREQELLNRYVEQRAHVVVYAPRNYGKTSVVKNIISEEFRCRHKRCFVFFAELMGIRSMNSLEARLRSAFERSFEESFPLRNLLDNARHFISSLRPEISIDPLTGSPSLSLGITEQHSAITIQSLFTHMANILREIPGLVVLDEFQDIALIPEASGTMRAAFEEVDSAPVILMGSKQHLLANLFAKPEAPLAAWGTDLEFSPIPYNQYHKYIVDRFEQNSLDLSLENATYLQDLMQRVPEAVNRLCQQILDLNTGKEIEKSDITAALRELLENRESRYEAYLAQFSPTEERVLIAVAGSSEVKKPQSKTFLARVNLTNRSVAQVFKRLMDRSILEKNINGYRISDPLLAAYLKYYR